MKKIIFNFHLLLVSPLFFFLNDSIIFNFHFVSQFSQNHSSCLSNIYLYLTWFGCITAVYMCKYFILVCLSSLLVFVCTMHNINLYHFVPVYDHHIFINSKFNRLIFFCPKTTITERIFFYSETTAPCHYPRKYTINV